MKLMPLLPYLLTTAGLLSSLALFFTLKLDVRRHAQRYKARIEEMMARIDTAEHDAEHAPRFISQESAPEPAMILVPAQPRAGLNLNKRVHAMRMLRRGEDVNHIAAALGVPRREVELMIRVSSLGKAPARQPLRRLILIGLRLFRMHFKRSDLNAAGRIVLADRRRHRHFFAIAHQRNGD